MKRASARVVKPEAQIQDYAYAQASDLIRRVAFRANRAEAQKSDQAVHDLRISIRRLTQCLRVFKQFFPEEKVRRVKRRLKKAMNLASEVRNRDIALGFLRRSKLPSKAPLLEAIADDRHAAAQALAKGLRPWSKKNIQKKWRNKLGL